MSTPAVISRARCHNHPTREAAARCVSCGSMYCSECVTLVDHRMICASCQKGTPSTPTKKKRDWFILNTAAQLVVGLFILWFTVYITGRFLISIPDDMHSGAVWEKFRP
jgi:hypothetical protein